jgi:hypothetical protein
MFFAFLAATLFIECENFADKGGWTLDPSSTGEMGSSYLMAHGYGVAVKDAETSFDVERAGRYSLCVRTRNWAAPWSKGAPGIFKLAVDGTLLDKLLGDNGGDWDWVVAGERELAAGRHTLTLRDLAGFNGRADAVIVTDGPTDGETLEKVRLKAQSPAPADGGEYDFIVVGGGV